MVISLRLLLRSLHSSTATTAGVSDIEAVSTFAEPRHARSVVMANVVSSQFVVLLALSVAFE